MLKFKEKDSNEMSDIGNSIAEGTQLVGDISTSSSLIIKGHVKGNIHTSAKVTIGPTGMVKGNIVCEKAEIEGRVDGELKVHGLLVLRSTANISGDIFTSKFQVDEGASFNGSCQMVKESQSIEFEIELPLEPSSTGN